MLGSGADAGQAIEKTKNTHARTNKNTINEMQRARVPGDLHGFLKGILLSNQGFFFPSLRAGGAVVALPFQRLPERDLKKTENFLDSNEGNIRSLEDPSRIQRGESHDIMVSLGIPIRI